MRRSVTKEEILVDSVLKQQIAKELRVTTECVRKALKYHSNSVLSKRIRQRAKVLLIEEANRIEDMEE